MTELLRPSQSAAEIALLPALGTTQCTEHVRASGHGLTPETLVYVTREAIGAGDSTLVELCARLLLGKEGKDGRWHGGQCERTITILAYRYHLNTDRALMRAFRARCFEQLWLAIYAGRDRKPFYEARFGVAFWQLCIDAAKSIVRKGSRDMEAGVTDDTGAGTAVDDLVDDRVELLDEKIIRELLNPINEAVLLGAIRMLPERQAHAALLHWVEGKLIEGPEDSVCAIMGVTPRAVYKLIAKARTTLQSDPRIRAIRFGEA